MICKNKGCAREIDADSVYCKWCGTRQVRERKTKDTAPTARQLPSGSWTCRVRVDGRDVSITRPTKAEAQAEAMAIKHGLKAPDTPEINLTLGEAIDRYIEMREGILSPSTVAGYKRIRKNAFPALMGQKLSALSHERVQRAVNAMAGSSSPKSVRNAYGLLSAAVGEFAPDISLHVTLPQKIRAEIVLPSEDDIKAIAAAVAGKWVELPVLLAMCLGLRMSEIRGLTRDCINGSVLHVKQALVDEGEKAPKTYNSDRYLTVPAHILSLISAIPADQEYLCPQGRRAIYYAFTSACERAGIKHYRFHDLRHVNASVMLKLGVPDKYAMERMGHATNNMLKTVYQHTMPAERVKVDEEINEYFSAMWQQNDNGKLKNDGI
jgi:integrase